MDAPQKQQQAKPQSPLDKALLAFGDTIYKRDSDNRFAEDRQWYEAALFDQLKQWLTYNDSNRSFVQIKQNRSKPVPMPVTNHFSKTINANANSLGAAIPEMDATADDASSTNRRAAEAAKHAFPEMDRESGMEILNPILAKHVPLWGLGVTKETIDISEANGVTELPDIDMQTSSMATCPQCGYSGDAGQSADPAQPQTQQPCPQCGSPMETEEPLNPMVGQMNVFPKGKITTEIIPIMEIYLPRDCRDPNLAKRITHRYRKPKQKAESLYPDSAPLQADESRNVNQFYMEALRSLVLSSTNDGEMTTLTEIWCKWDELTDEVQDQIESEWQAQPSAAYPEMMKLDACKKYGFYFIFSSGKILTKAENPWEGESCFTFFPWQKDAASPYPKPLSVELIPCQKRLNRTDSLIESGMMMNAAGKWIIPNTQLNISKVTGSPADIMWWDPIGDGKQRPEFVQPQPFAAITVAYRASIINDFRELGYTQGVSTGDNPGPGGPQSFRGIAYLGAKAEENIQTQRFLWEQAHLLRKRKLLIIARKVWDEPRKAKVAGFNGNFGMQQLSGADLQGDFAIDVIKDSSRPKTRQEKLQAVQIGVQGGLIDVTDTAVRDRIMTWLDLTDLDAADHLNYEKADRMLENLKAGIIPFESPFTKWDIPLKIFANYTLTEEFEGLDQRIQQGILHYTQYISDKLAAVQQGPAAMANPMNIAGQQLANAIGGNNKDPMSGIPGKTEMASQAEQGAQSQGNSLAGALA